MNLTAFSKSPEFLSKKDKITADEKKILIAEHNRLSGQKTDRIPRVLYYYFKQGFTIPQSITFLKNSKIKYDEGVKRERNRLLKEQQKQNEINIKKELKIKKQIKKYQKKQNDKNDKKEKKILTQQQKEQEKKNKAEEKKVNLQLKRDDEINKKKVIKEANTKNFLEKNPNFLQEYEVGEQGYLRRSIRMASDKIKYFIKYTYENMSINNLNGLFQACQEQLIEDNATSIILLFVNNKNQVIHKTIDGNYCYDYNDFVDRINEVIEGRIEGSDGLSLDNEVVLELNHFQTVGVKIAGYGKSHKFLFKTVGIESDEEKITNDAGKTFMTDSKNCGSKCLQYILKQMGNKKLKANYSKFQTLEEISDFINDNDLKIGIIPNAFIANQENPLHKIVFRNGKEGVERILHKGAINFINKIDVNDFSNGSLINKITYTPILTEDEKIMKAETRKAELEHYLSQVEELSKVEKNPRQLKIYNDYKKYIISELGGELKEIKTPINDIDECDYFIIYDDDAKHYDVILNNKIEINDGFKISLTGNIFLETKDDEGNIINHFYMKTQTNNKNLINDLCDEVRTQYLFFDYETVVDWKSSNCVKPYSVSFLNLNKDDKLFDKIVKYDESKNIDEINKLLKKNCLSYTGFDCNEKFIKWILENQQHTKFVFCSFNGASFDNLILMDGLLRMNEFVEIGIDQILYNGNSLLNFRMNGRHTCWDLRKHLTQGKLSDLCDSFKIKICSKKELDHSKYQKLYESGDLETYITDNEELRVYNEYDVLSTALLMIKYRNIIKNIKGLKKIGESIENVSTIGSLVYNLLTDDVKQKKINLPKVEYGIYKDLLKFKIAGRVEMFNGFKEIHNEVVMSFDVCSLYPYQMAIAPNYYPCGDIINVCEESAKRGYINDQYRYIKSYNDEPDVEVKNDYIGFWYCDIDQTNLKEKNLPLIYAQKTDIMNNWDYEGVLENYLISSVMINSLRKYGCKVTIKHGFYFSDKVKGCELFGFILDFMGKKNQQDTYKSNGDELYNPALRETMKLMMNAPSGKVIEGLHTNKVVSIDNINDYINILNKSANKKVNCINSVGNRLFASIDVSEESICQKEQRPVYLGIMIYDYSKTYMYDNFYAIVGKDKLLYTDTDAGKILKKDAGDWLEYAKNTPVPHWEEVLEYDARYETHKLYDENSKVFGSYENELDKMGTGINSYFSCVEKKSWCYSDNGKTKVCFKGLSKNSIILNGDEDILIKKINAIGDVSLELCDKSIVENAIKIKDFFNDGNNTLQHKAVDFFKRLNNKEDVYVLCFSFSKSVKNNKQNVMIDDIGNFNTKFNGVIANYNIKKISLNKLNNDEEKHRKKLIKDKKQMIKELLKDIETLNK
jgi:hypothetical protein